jgi:hypothetical protein
MLYSGGAGDFKFVSSDEAGGTVQVAVTSAVKPYTLNPHPLHPELYTKHPGTLESTKK